MKPFLIGAMALAILTGGALAQAAPPTPAGAPAPAGMTAAPPRVADDDAAGDPSPPGAPHGLRPPPGGPGPMDEAGPRGHRPPPPSKAAHFRLHRGDTALDVQCAEDEPMKACGDLTLQLLDKLQATPKP